MSSPAPARAVTLPAEAQEDGVHVRIRVVPRASRTEAAGLHGDALRVRVAAPPVDGKANAALVMYLAKELAVPRSAVRIVRGDTGRTKTVEVRGDPVRLSAAVATLAGAGRA